ncbi:hypothetical protein E2562_018933 [Oryza meyeriana var. granulata]|uniref:Uncharacterized protein n=1 Tax=Oryza meyeriana var. granulata TaxID=110450 RepID=A0A6G1DJT7_9ORYZ|nr:hypothetical protein E2562_018933 [Oryza meyeriana var. granulata]
MSASRYMPPIRERHAVTISLRLMVPTQRWGLPFATALWTAALRGCVSLPLKPQPLAADAGQQPSGRLGARMM